MFNTDPNNPPNAFSAVKALQLAAAQGQRIYQITQANISSTLPQLNLDYETEKEILNAVNVGKEVVTHTDLVTVPGFTGAGYIILDPVTGDGAFKISGGGNGAFIFLLASALVAILGLFLIPVLAASSAVIFAEIAFLGGISNFLLGAIEFLFIEDIPYNPGAALAFLGLLGSIISLLAATTVSAGVFPVIGIAGFIYWFNSLV